MSCEYTTRTTPSAVMYSVQKSKSFGGTKHELMDIKTQFERLKSEYGGGKSDSEKEKSDLVDKKAADELPMTPELGRKTPNLGSLRRKFALRSRGLSQEDSETDSSWKKKNKNKVGNFFKWFKKERMEEEEEEEEEYGRSRESDLSPPLERRNQLFSSSKPKPRSLSLESIWSTGSASSSFAFVPVQHYKVGRYIEPKKKIAISINCGPDTYRARLNQVEQTKEKDQELTLRTKYHLYPSDSPPPPEEEDINLSNHLPFGQFNPKPGSGLDLDQTPLKNIDSGSDSDITVEENPSYPAFLNLKTNSGSKETSRKANRGIPGATRIENRGGKLLGSDQTSWEESAVNSGQISPVCSSSSLQQRIKPRQYSGQLIYPITIKPEEKEAFITNISLDLKNGDFKVYESGIKKSGPVREKESVSKPDFLPKKSADPAARLQSCSPCGDIINVASSLSSGFVSPRGSLYSEDQRPIYHAIGKRRAPDPPGVIDRQSPSSIYSDGSQSSSKRGSRKKNPAPPPPNPFSIIPSSRTSFSLETLNINGVDTDLELSASQRNKSLQSFKSLNSSQLDTNSPSLKMNPENDSWVLEDGVLRSSRDSRSDLSTLPFEEKEAKDNLLKAPMSPKPWYKRSIRDTQEKKSKEKKEKKDKSPENLPEIQPGRESIKVQESFEEKYSYFTRMSRENINEMPRSPKQFLRSKLLTSSPKPDRPTSRPISGLTGISDLDRQAAEIIRKKNEEDAAKKKKEANDKFYEAEPEPQAVIDTIMENMSRRMLDFDRKQSFSNSKHPSQDINQFINRDKKKEILIANVGCESEGLEKIDELMNTTVVNMDSVVSDLNSFLASTRRAMSSPAQQKRNASLPGSQSSKISSLSNSQPKASSFSGSQPMINSFSEPNSKSSFTSSSQSKPNTVSINHSQVTSQNSSSQGTKGSTNSISLARTESPVEKAGISTMQGKPGQHSTKSSPVSTNNSIWQSKPGALNKGYGNGNRNSLNISMIPEVSENSSSQSTPHEGNAFFRDQERNKGVVHDNRNSRYLENLPKSNLPPPLPSYLPPLAVEKADGWSCNRCTLLNYSAQIWCEACGGKRLEAAGVEESMLKEQSAIRECDLDKEAEEAPPRVGHVLDKLVLFSSIEARAQETPSLSRRRSGEFNNISKTQSFSTKSMGAKVENPLQRTLERISQNQAQLTKPSALLTPKQNQQKPGVQPYVTVIESDMTDCESPQNSRSKIIKEQKRLLEQAQLNLLKQRQHMEKLELAEQTSSLPRTAIKPDSDENTEKNVMMEKLEIIETNSGPESSIKSSPGVKRSSSFKGSFDFTKTPRSFLNQAPIKISDPESILLTRKINKPDNSQKIIQGSKQDFKMPKTNDNKTSFSNHSKKPETSVNKFSNIAAPFSEEAKNRKISNDSDTQSTKNLEDDRLAPKFTGKSEESEKLDIKKVSETNSTSVPKLEFLSANISRKYSGTDQQHVRQARLEYFNGPDKIMESSNIILPKKQSTVSNSNKTSSVPKDKWEQITTKEVPKLSTPEKIPKLPAKRSSEPHYAKPVSPPRPVTPPRPAGPPQPECTTRSSCVQQSAPPRPDLPSLSTQSIKPVQQQAVTANIWPKHKDVEKNQSLNQSRANTGQEKQASRIPVLVKYNSPPLTYTPETRSRSTTPSLTYSPVLHRSESRSNTPSYSSYFQQQGQNRHSFLARNTDWRQSKISDYDSDYSQFEMSRDYVRSPILYTESNLARIGSTSIISESNYSAITPDVSRKLSLSHKIEPKFSKDFGFVSSKKESIPKPPRRTRSKDVSSRPGSRISNSSRPCSRTSNPSRETTPVNQIPKDQTPLASPLRPNRFRNKTYSQTDGRTQSRPRSYQDYTPEPLYEILTPLNTFPSKSKSVYSSSSSDSDFLTPQASPKISRSSSRSHSQTYKADPTHLSYSYENFQDNPIQKDRRRIPRAAKNTVEYTVSTRIDKPRKVPPRASLEPIPTPRKSTLGRSRDGSREKEPYYKIPPPNPVPVNHSDHLYSEPVYKYAKNARRTQLPKQASFASDESNTSELSDNYDFVSIKEEQAEIPVKENKSKKAEIRTKNKKTELETKTLEKDSSLSSRSSNKSKKNSETTDDKNSDKKPMKSSENRTKKVPELVSNYVPVEMPLRPDWFDLQPPLEPEQRPKSIIDGVLYTSRSLLETNQKSKPLAFNLILPEIFETYDVCRHHPKLGKESSSEKLKFYDKKEPNLKDSEKKEQHRKNSDRTELNLKDSDGKEPNLKSSERKEPDRKGSDRKEPGLKSSERKEPDRTGFDRKESNLKSSERKEPDRKGSDRKEPDLKGFEKLDKSEDLKSFKKNNVNESQGKEESFEGRLHDDVFLRQDSYENTAHLAPRSEVMRVEARPDVRLEARSETRKSSSDNSFKQTDDGERVRSLLVGGGQGGGGGGQEEQQDLLLRLEDAISRGDHRYAAALAKQLSKIKISSRLVEQEDRSGTQPDPLLQDTGKLGKEERKRIGAERQISKESKESKESDKPVSKQTIKVQMYVEDAVSAQGPISVEINPAHSVADLKLQIEGEFEIPVSVQRWILGRNLVIEDTQTISSHGVEKENQKIYLYLVLPEEKEPEPEAPAKQELPVTNSPPHHRIPPSNQPFVKGRYWNYEEERWSFCNSDDDEERTDEIKDMEKTENMKKEEKDKKEEKKQKEKEKGEQKDVEKDEKGKEEDGEWEYYYEDVEEKKDNAKETEKDIVNDKERNEDHVPEIFPQKVPENIAEWECPVCTLKNPLERPGCQACTTERPAQLGAAAAPEPAANLPEADPPGEKSAKTGGLDAYKQLENLDIIPNAETFECVICFLEIEPGDGVVLRECLHTFCRVCLGAGIEHSDSPKVKCPFKDDNYSCDMDLLEREIKALVSPAVYEKHQKKSVKEAEANIKGAFHCKTPDCAGWTVIDDNVNVFKCPLCKRSNCITCQAVHDDMDCKQYQQYTLNDANDENTKKTKQWIDGLIGTGEALYCPSCQVLLLKKWGCDWVRCTYCRTEICWVTKQLRWGPNGRGDTSGGCKCMLDGRTKCHKLCNYCH